MISFGILQIIVKIMGLVLNSHSIVNLYKIIQKFIICITKVTLEIYFYNICLSGIYNLEENQILTVI